MGLAEKAFGYLMSGDKRLGEGPTEWELDIFREYMRRMALWTRHFTDDSVWLFGDLHHTIMKNFDYRYWPKVAPQIRQSRYAVTMERHIERILKFYELADTLDILEKYPLPDPYEPLLFLLANGRTPNRGPGYIELGYVGIRLTMSEVEYARCEPFVNMDEVYRLPQLS